MGINWSWGTSFLVVSIVCMCGLSYPRRTVWQIFRMKATTTVANPMLSILIVKLESSKTIIVGNVFLQHCALCFVRPFAPCTQAPWQRLSVSSTLRDTSEEKTQVWMRFRYFWDQMNRRYTKRICIFARGLHGTSADSSKMKKYSRFSTKSSSYEHYREGRPEESITVSRMAPVEQVWKEFVSRAQV